jgi:hypothetical protein
MEKFHARRLLKLATFLEKRVPQEKFDISVWACEKKGCGTVACVGGWAGLMAEFRKLGLRTVRRHFEVRFRPKTKEDKKYVAEEAYDQNSTHYGFDACELFFGVPPYLKLFQTLGYPELSVTPKVVAKRLRRVVKLNQPEVYRQYLARKRRLAAKA